MMVRSLVARRADAWFVYIAICKDGSLYTGVARDVAARIAKHNAGKGARYTRGRGPIALGAKARRPTQGDALRLEIAVKALSREKKIAFTERPRKLGAFARTVRFSLISG